MRDRYLKSNLFVCCSSLENSPNSLGEAMLLGMPCVSADVGGISSVFTRGEDGVMYEGHRLELDPQPKLQPELKAKSESGHKSEVEGENNINNTCHDERKRLIFITNALADAILEIWGDRDKMKTFCQNARKHAEITHGKDRNYQTMMEIYAKINSTVSVE